MKVKTRKEHRKIYKFLWIITYILFIPFVILNYLEVLLELIVNSAAGIRNKIVYTIMEFLFERSNEEWKKK